MCNYRRLEKRDGTINKKKEKKREKEDENLITAVNMLDLDLKEMIDITRSEENHLKLCFFCSTLN